MNVSELLRNTRQTLFTFEVLPPLKGGSFQEIENTIKPLLDFNPSYINITSHRSDVAFRQTAGGGVERYRTRKRPGSVGIAAAIKYKFGVEVVPHIICAGFTKDETEDNLIDCHYLGLNNLLVLRGDKAKSEPFFVPEVGGYPHAIDLLRQVQNLNKGIYLDSTGSTATDFSCGVAGYPEGHSPETFEQDFVYLKEKVDAGAQYIVTQMFFDNEVFYNFVKRCREIGINVPIVPGLKPVALKNQANVLPKLFNIVLPETLKTELENSLDDRAAKEIGTEWLIAQCKDLKAHGVPSLHIYTYGISDSVVRMCREVF